MIKPQHKPVGFREFLIGDLFEDPIRGVRIISDLRVKGDIPLITAGYEKEGIAGYIQPLDFQKIMDGLNITIDMFGNVFLRNHEYVADDNILSIDFSDFNENIGLYIVAVLRKKIQGFNYSKQFRLKTYYDLTIQLPVLANNQPDYEYMDYFVEELKHKYVEELDAWWSQAGFASLPDTLLTSKDRNVIKKYQQAQFNQVLLSDMFNIINDKVKITDADFDKYPEVLAQTANNGVAHSEFGQPSLLKGLTIGMRGSFNTYMHDSPFIIGPNVAGLQLKQSTRDDEAIYLYVSADLNKQYARFSGYTNYPTFTKLKNEVEITVPMTNDDLPDYELIIDYMQVMKKLTIQTHRAWLDEQLVAYQSLI